mgnify:CR=1 FL=1
MNTLIAKISTVAGIAAAGALPLAAHAQQQEMARVISTTPVMQQVAVSRQVCQDEAVSQPGQKSGAGALMGGIAGGALGNAMGKGSGNAATTALGAVASLTIQRGTDLTRLMVTMGIALVLLELANKFDTLTGGTDGLQGVLMGPLFGRFVRRIDVPLQFQCHHQSR